MVRLLVESAGNMKPGPAVPHSRTRPGRGREGGPKILNWTRGRDRVALAEATKKWRIAGDWTAVVQGVDRVFV